ncbi:MAG TPA: SDR family oxidoreductase [Acidobacteriaceae bacterium]
MAPLTGKVAIVTGSSRGIGRAIAERLGKDGASVVVNYVRNADKSREVVSAIETAGGRALAVRADMSQIADVRCLFQETLDQFGRLDILVNNAGWFQPHPIAEVTEDEFDAAFALNAKGAFFAFQEAARGMGDGGRIINISSCSTAMSLPGFAVYVGSKAAGEQFARALAKELGGRSITVNTVSPGFTETDMLPQDPEWRKMGAQMSALGRLGQADDIADVVTFLISEKGKWITGHNIQACGGVVM